MEGGPMEVEGNHSNEYFEHQEIQVDGKQSQLRIDKFLMDRLYKVSRNKLQAAM